MATVSYSDANTDHDLVTAPAGKHIYLTEVIYSNGGAAMTKVSLRYDAITTDYIPFYCAASGGGLALNLIQSESVIGIAASTLKTRQTVAGAVSVTVWYFIAD